MLTGLLTINLIMHTFSEDLNSHLNCVEILFLSLASLVVKTDHVKSDFKMGVGLLLH